MEVMKVKVTNPSKAAVSWFTFGACSPIPFSDSMLYSSLSSPLRHSASTSASAAAWRLKHSQHLGSRLRKPSWGRHGGIFGKQE